MATLYAKGIQVVVVDVGTADDFDQRASRPGVLFAHRFAEDAELDVFIRGTQAGNPLTLVATPFSGTLAIRSKAIGTSIVNATPSGVAGDLQWWDVKDASVLPTPESMGGPYNLLVGRASVGGMEYVQVNAVDTALNKVQVKRRMDSSALTIEGIFYPYPQAGSYPGGSVYTIGKGPDGSWIRPLGAFAAGNNGRSVDDIGISNGAARKTRSWNPTLADRHHRFREAYFGHRSYWDPTVGDALYKDWLPHDPGAGAGLGTRMDAFEGDELWIQFRAKVSSARFLGPLGKMLFIQNASTSGTGQFFWGVGPKTYDTSPGNFGNVLVPLTAYADSAAPAGGTLSVPQRPGLGYSGVEIQSAESYPLCQWQYGSSRSCWRIPGDVWVTYLLHFKFGRDNAPINPTNPDVGGASGAASTLNLTGPWPAETDPNYRTTFELFVAEEGKTEYTKLTSSTNFIWFFGDGKYQAGYYYYNPPGLNAIWMSQNLNDYIGSGSVAPPPEPHWIDYTQLIVSRAWIAPPGLVQPPSPPLPPPPPPPPPAPPSAPTYIVDMVPFQSRKLTGAYAPTNGQITLYGLIGAGWKNGQIADDPIVNHALNVMAYSGGAGDSARGRLWFQGGGHAASWIDGVYYYDVNGDAAPTGWVKAFESDRSYVSANILAWISAYYGTTFTSTSQAGFNAISHPHPNYPLTGVPGSVHTYANLFLAGDKLIRFRGAGNRNGGPGPLWYWDITNQTWVKPAADIGGSSMQVWAVVYDEATGIAALFVDYQVRWLDCKTMVEIGTPRNHSHDLSQNPCAYYDPVRKRALLHNVTVVGKAAIKFDLNFTSFTAVPTILTFSGDTSLFDFTTPAVIAPAGFFDAALDRFWFMAGVEMTANVDKVYWINAADLDDSSITVYSQGVVGDKQSAITTNIGSKRPYNRVLWKPEWRAFFVAPNEMNPVYVIRLPNP